MQGADVISELVSSDWEVRCYCRSVGSRRHGAKEPSCIFTTRRLVCTPCKHHGQRCVRTAWRFESPQHAEYVLATMSEPDPLS